MRFKWETEFKETEIGEIPKEWEIEKLDWAVRSLESGNRPKGGSLKHAPNGILSIGGENITWQGELVLDNCLRFKEEFYRNLNRGKIEEEDILLVKDGATIGKLAYIKEIPEGRAMVNEHVFLIKTHIERYNPKLLFYYLFSESGQMQIESAIGGSAQGGINREILNIVKIPKFDITEQSRIAKVLSWFDDLIENKKRQNEILEKTAMAIFKSWFIDFEPFSAKGGSATGEKDSEFVDSELGRIPKGWEVKELRRVVNTQYGLTASSEDIGDTKLLRITDINKTFVIDWDNVPYCNIAEDKLLKYELKDKDIVISRIADIGKVAIIENPPKSVFASYLIRLKPKLNKITPYYLYYWLKSPSYQEYIEGAAEGSTRQNTNAEVIKSGPILIPDEKVIREFEKIAENIRSKIILNQKQIMILRKIRDTLLPLLVFGKLRVEEV